MIRLLVITLGLTCSSFAKAENIIDVYGVDVKKGNSILKKYSTEVVEIENLFNDTLKNEKNQNLNLPDNILTKKILLLEKIKKEGHFLYVNIDNIYYPENKISYITIEVVKKNQAQKLKFISPIYNSNYGLKKDLINDMNVYMNKSAQLLYNNTLDLKNNTCPVFHCFGGFTHPTLKPYLTLFNKGVIKQKALIVKTLTKDPNPERRMGAIYLTGHFSNPKEIITLLSTQVENSDAQVRNAAMRVLVETLNKANISEINVIPFLDLLDSPYDTDRNKALLVLLKAVESPSARMLVIQKGEDKLLSLLQLKQPNNHIPSYLILKKISGKDFGEHNILAWKRWFSLTNRSTV